MLDLSTFGYTEIEKLEKGIPARITAVHRERYEVMSANGAGYARCKTSAYRGADANYPTVGDFVELLYNASGDGTILRTLPRHSSFARSDYAGHAAGYVKTVREQLVAANFDYVFILQSLNHDFNLKRMERYLALARQSGGTPIVILTKLDVAQDVQAYTQKARALCGDTPVHAVSSVTGAGMEALAPYLRAGRTLVFLGSSGVGKSSLLNALAGETVMDTAGIRLDDSKGRHTTTHRQLVRLPSGVLVMDTPGMRELGMWDAAQGVAETFPDIMELIAQCRFSDCGHKNEPKCAVRAALESGTLPKERWERYLALQNETDFVRKRIKPMRK